jgi:murein DD-endopeptidase MepM/ murein hydrolase activator NlpD
MRKQALRRHLTRLGSAVLLGGLCAACAATAPAPVEMNGAAPGISLESEAPPLAAPSASRRIVVRPGQSLGRIALEYHVAKREIITANHLSPPYKVEIGQVLMIPAAAVASREVASVPLAPLGPQPLAAPPPALAAGHPSADIIPLDGPPPASAPPPALRPVAPQTLTPPPAASPKTPGGPSAAEEARAAPPEPALPHGGHLPWPVHGRVLAAYGAASGGGRNDGINIGAPRGAAIESVDEGVVAYAGNELRGYGNLVLIKHPDGFISAYAHCDELLVKKGEKIRRGQVIAKVGATGGVSEPQLHFELRRGKQAVDPREFLAPAPSASQDQVRKAG